MCLSLPGHSVRSVYTKTDWMPQIACMVQVPGSSRLAALVQVPAADLDSWQQLPVYFGTNVASVCRGMTQPQVSAFFSRGRLCVRAYHPLSGTST